MKPGTIRCTALLAFVMAGCAHRPDAVKVAAETLVALDGCYSSWFMEAVESAQTEAELRALEEMEDRWSALMASLRSATLALRRWDPEPWAQALDRARQFLSALGAEGIP